MYKLYTTGDVLLYYIMSTIKAHVDETSQVPPHVRQPSVNAWKSFIYICVHIVFEINRDLLCQQHTIRSVGGSVSHQYTVLPAIVRLTFFRLFIILLHLLLLVVVSRV